jgi:hypothetical protein
MIIQPVFDPCSGMGIAPAHNVALFLNIPTDCGDLNSGSTAPPAVTPGVSISYTSNCNTLEKGSTHIREVCIGRVRLKKQYDRRISFTNNGGGSEMRFCSAGGRDNVDTNSLGNITLDQWNVRKSACFSRRDIRTEDA